MPSARALAVCSFFAAVALAASARAENWPAWRGPTGQGHSTEKNVPTKWSAKENVKWKVALEFPGNSTPIVWGDRIFLTQANKDATPKKDEKGKFDAKQSKSGTTRSLLCLSRADGKILWQKDVAYDIRSGTGRTIRFATPRQPPTASAWSCASARRACTATTSTARNSGSAPTWASGTTSSATVRRRSSTATS